MKRGAEKQITREQGSDDEVEEVPGGGFKKADESTLARRPMRGLPKRAGLGTAPAPTVPVNGSSTPETSTVPKFGGFSGFGVPSSSSLDFSFKPPASAGVGITPVQPSSSLFPASSFSLPSGQPSVTETASATAKTFASFLGTPTKSPASADVEMSQPSTSTSTPSNDPALKYYTSLRGLNVSFLSAATKAIDEDPFFDVASMLTQYQSLRSGIQKESDAKPSATFAKSEPTFKAAVMPAPPTSFAGFSPLTTTSSSTPASGGFTPSPSTTTSNKSGFSFPSTASSATTSNNKPAFSFPSTTPSATTSSLFSSFGSQSSTTQKETTANSGFNFSKPTDAKPSETTTRKDSAPVSIFGSSASSNPFGKPSGAPVSFFGSGTTTTASSNPFGKTDASSTFASEKPTASTSFFGSSPSSTTTPFSGFGKPSSGSIGNPVGFGFGSPSTTPDATSAKSSGFSFGQPPEKKAEPDAAEESTTSGDNAEENKPENAGGLSISNPHDEEGEGEENEDTVHVIRVKAHRLKKESEKGGAGWAELGVGMLRLKKHKETGTRRMLMRNSANGKININFNLYSGLKPSQSKKALTFIGHDETGASQTYTVRASNEDQIKELKEILEREIAFVKAKDES